MFFLCERINKIVEELSNYIYTEKVIIENFWFQEGHFKSIEEAEKKNNWMPFGKEDWWGGQDKNYWFKTEFVIPEKFHDKEVALIVYTNSNGWDAVNPQFIAYINGRPVQGIDVNHREVILEERYKKGDKIRIDLNAYSGLINAKLKLFVKLAVFNRDVYELYFDILVPLKIVQLMPEENLAKHRIMNILNESVNLLDLRKPLSESFFKSCKDAREFLKKELYERVSSFEDIVVWCIGHTHIDVAWHWRVAQARQKAARSFLTALKLMNEYPEFIFISSQPQLYKFVKEDYPEIYQMIKQKITSGQWEAEGGMWLEPDCNLTSGESLIRQIIFGKRFFTEEFGVDSKVLWLPDVFGYNAALPQILKKSGIDYFMTTKISWNQFNKFPYDTFMWQGIDGTQILTHFITTKDYKSEGFFTTYNGILNPSQVMGTWERYQQKSINNEVLMCFGYGDGGGGPTREMLENAKRLKNGIGSCPKVKIGKVKEYFDRLYQRVKDNKYLPKWVGELYLEYHRGTYTSMGRNKRYNRLCELKYLDAEFFSSVARDFRIEYPQDNLNSGWETILLNQFHDILPGSAIKEVYEDSKEQYEKILKEVNEIIYSRAKAISSKVRTEEKALVVFNTLSFEATQPIEFECNNQKDVCLVDSNGQGIVCQRTYDGKYVCVLKSLPPKGYKVFYLREKVGSHLEDKHEITVLENCIENKYFRILLDEKGNFISLFDKTNEREVLQPGKKGNRIVAFEDKPMNFDNWDIDIYYREKYWEVEDIERIEVLESGPVRGILRIIKRFVDSKIVQDIVVYNDIPRIDFKTTIDWKENQIMLKVFFPIDVNADKATFDIQFGNIERPTHFNTSWDVAKFEVVAHKWVDISEDNFGVSLLNDSKYGHSVYNNEIGLTLLKSGIEPNKEADREVHQLVYSLYPHSSSWKIAKTHQMAYSLNVQPIVVWEEKHDGELPSEFSFARIDKENVVIEVIKKAEYSDDLIVRVYEFWNRREKVTLTLWKTIKKVYECDLLENEIEEIKPQGNSFDFEIKPYEIRSFKIVFD